MSLAVVPGDCIDGRPWDPSRLDRIRDAVRVTSESPSPLPWLFQKHPPLNPPYHHVQGTAQRRGPASSAGDLWPPPAGWDQGPYQWTPQHRSSQVWMLNFSIFTTWFIFEFPAVFYCMTDSDPHWFIFCRSRVRAAERLGGLFPGDQLRPGSAHPVLSEGATR